MFFARILVFVCPGGGVLSGVWSVYFTVFIVTFFGVPVHPPCVVCTSECVLFRILVTLFLQVGECEYTHCVLFSGKLSGLSVVFCRKGVSDFCQFFEEVGVTAPGFLSEFL